MKALFQVLMFGVVMLSVSCAQKLTAEQKVIEDIPTNPSVNQRAVEQKNKEIMPNDPQFRPIRMEEVDTVMVPTGSLFHSSQAASLYQLYKNYQVGDMILVELDESTTSKKKLDYKSDKKSNFQLGPLSVSAGPININEGDISVEHYQENEKDSSAETNQSNSLNGNITVYVVDILPNRNLVVAGEKWIKLSTGEEYVRFSGEIRTADISASNSVISSKVGNTRIEYSGKGELQDNQKDSVLDKMFSIFR
ncbi:MAG: flagellar basal body L-ring protein FlgH [Paraglaciecola sp.]|uniref:flagellar basal body L-ring protein FlgH n=1 Tax=Paraglaciecola sp. TaxID=1920173 RepID=UPI00273D882E|nr:flagellar basal body L-ring protein FlgH [Paraglaciecola sp.]MDP5030910.1 flagellar basal body L-ring protein FlgH [Paraglaciecola sp.]MDP5132266.1 flagellar basal body L-ring protein FlgH [Paraglaciecola sp.]